MRSDFILTGEHGRVTLTVVSSLKKGDTTVLVEFGPLEAESAPEMLDLIDMKEDFVTDLHEAICKCVKKELMDRGCYTIGRITHVETDSNTAS